MKAYIETFKRYQYLLSNLITRDFKVKYRRSVLGIAWSLLNPILMMLILNAVFSRIFGGHFDIQYFPLYLISGQILFGFFNEATSGAIFSIVEASSLIKKVYIPKYIFPAEKVLFAFVNLLLSMSAIIVMLVIFGVPFSWTMFLFIVPLIAMLGFTMGYSLLMSCLCVFFRDLRHLHGVFLTALMYCTPIIYPSALVADSWIRYIVYINPLTWYIEYFRTVVMYGQLPTWQTNVVCFGYAALFMIIGLAVFKKGQDRFILNI